MWNKAIHIYETLIGLREEGQRMPMVENAFSPGSECDRLYTEVYNANCRICQRLGVSEDRDVETIINNLWKISQILSMKMYEYGQKMR